MISVIGVEIPDTLVIEYYRKMINKIYAILPVFEGKNYFTKKVEYPADFAYDNFKRYLSNLLCEVTGSSELFIVNVTSLELLSNLRGLYESDSHEHSKVKSIVMGSISLCERIIEEIKVLEGE